MNDETLLIMLILCCFVSACYQFWIFFTYYDVKPYPTNTSLIQSWSETSLNSLCVCVCVCVCVCMLYMCACVCAVYVCECMCECSQQTRGQAWWPPVECCIDLLLVNKQLDATGGSIRLACLPASQHAFLLGRRGSLRSCDPAVAWKLHGSNILGFLIELKWMFYISLPSWHKSQLNL